MKFFNIFTNEKTEKTPFWKVLLNLAIIIGACVLMVLTCIGMPVNDCFRYFAPVAASFPALLMLLPKGYGDCT